ncbi:Protein of unknown function DUF3704 containing protein [Cricetulus griseus]|uniref:Uncharacterized protein n=1 Tax=Cricetulus griseus TaxID=10029 RepID=A0A061IIL9_CRIGR|nr:Protein of unknown function DUF3704 containing protein [Cricetulus griseus]
MHTKTWDDLKSGAEEKEEKKERKRNCGSLDVECSVTTTAFHLFFYVVDLVLFTSEGHLGCFQVLDITNNAAVNIVEQMSLMYECASFGYMPKSKIAGS